MYFVYILFSVSSGKTYVGFTNNVERRLQEHNFTETSGFTLRYRPWTLIRTEQFDTKQLAMTRERFFKTGKGRDEIKIYIEQYISSSGAVSAAAEKD
jgi:putative endonuclease